VVSSTAGFTSNEVFWSGSPEEVLGELSFVEDAVDLKEVIDGRGSRSTHSSSSALKVSPWKVSKHGLQYVQSPWLLTIMELDERF
jgi:hypothetical protein